MKYNGLLAGWKGKGGWLGWRAVNEARGVSGQVSLFPFTECFYVPHALFYAHHNSLNTTLFLVGTPVISIVKMKKRGTE